ncbi:unnamed protein product [Arctogadus glacialis]
MIVGGKEVYLLTPSLGLAVAAGPINVSLSGEEGGGGAHAARQPGRQPSGPAMDAARRPPSSTSARVTRSPKSSQQAAQRRRSREGAEAMSYRPPPPPGEPSALPRRVSEVEEDGCETERGGGGGALEEEGEGGKDYNSWGEMMFEVIKGTGSGERTALMETRRSLSAPYNRQTDHEMKGAAREHGFHVADGDDGCLVQSLAKGMLP